MTPDPGQEPGTPLQGEIANAANVATIAGQPVQITGAGTTFFLSITENHGNCVLTAKATEGPLPTMTWAALYPTAPGTNPNTGYYPGAWFWLGGQDSLETSYPFGNNYYASINICTGFEVTGDNLTGSYAVAVQIGPT